MSQTTKDVSFPIPLSLAVAIMSSISCYTTSVGIEPMLDYKILAFAFAVAASLFMVVIAVQYVKTDDRWSRRMAFLGYASVAIVSILFNFNAIYGTFNRENLLYDEMSEKRNRLVKLRTQTINDIKDMFEVSKWEGELEAAKGRAGAEDNTPGDRGKGPKYDKIWREQVIPAQGKLDKSLRKAKPHLQEIESKIATVYPDEINGAIASEDPRKIRAAITSTVGVYNEISNNIGSVTGESYGSLKFDEKNVGSMSNAIKQIVGFRDKDAEGKAGVITSLFLSIIIDFLILFVVIFYAPRVSRQRSRGRRGGSPRPMWGGGNSNSGGTVHNRK